MAEVTFDYRNLLEVEGGLEDRELDEVRPRLREAVDELLGSSPGFMRLPKTGKYVEVSVRVAEEIQGSGEHRPEHSKRHPRHPGPREHLGQRRH